MWATRIIVSPLRLPGTRSWAHQDTSNSRELDPAAQGYPPWKRRSVRSRKPFRNRHHRAGYYLLRETGPSGQNAVEAITVGGRSSGSADGIVGTYYLTPSLRTI